MFYFTPYDRQLSSLFVFVAAGLFGLAYPMLGLLLCILFVIIFVFEVFEKSQFADDLRFKKYCQSVHSKITEREALICRVIAERQVCDKQIAQIRDQLPSLSVEQRLSATSRYHCLVERAGKLEKGQADLQCDVSRAHASRSISVALRAQRIF